MAPVVVATVTGVADSAAVVVIAPVAVATVVPVADSAAAKPIAPVVTYALAAGSNASVYSASGFVVVFNVHVSLPHVPAATGFPVSYPADASVGVYVPAG